MKQRIKIYTHEVIAHSQMNAIEKILNRQIDYTMALNTSTRSNIQFEATLTEIEKIKDNLGYVVMVKQDNTWVASN